MDASAEGESSKTVRRREDRGKRPARRRPQKAASVSQLIRQLQKIVFLDSDLKVTRRQVLHQTTTYIKELETTLDNLLKMRDDKMPCTLEQVKEEYLQLNCIDTREISLNPGVIREFMVAIETENASPQQPFH